MGIQVSFYCFIFLLLDDTCPETEFSLDLDVQSLDLGYGAAIISQNSRMLKGRNLRHVGFEKKNFQQQI